MNLIFNILVPIGLFFVWLRPSFSALGLILSQLFFCFLFYLPFWMGVQCILRKAHPRFLPFSWIFCFIFAGAFSLLILYGSIPFFLSWCALLTIGATAWIYHHGWKEVKWAAHSETDLSKLTFRSLFIFNVFTFGATGAFNPPIACDLSLVHLILPKIYVTNGGWINAWWARTEFLPLLTQSQYALQIDFMKHLGLRADLLPSISSLLLFYALVMITRVVLSEKNSRWFGSALLCISLTRWNLGTTYMDLPSSTMVLGVTMSLVLSFATATFAEGLLTGFLFSAALGAKHMSLFFTVPLVLIWWILRWVQNPSWTSRKQELR